MQSNRQLQPGRVTGTEKDRNAAIETAEETEIETAQGIETAVATAVEKLEKSPRANRLRLLLRWYLRLPCKDRFEATEKRLKRLV